MLSLNISEQVFVYQENILLYSCEEETVLLNLAEVRKYK